MTGNSTYLKVKGGKALRGEVNVNGSKNSILALIPAMCLGEGEGVLTHVTDISDVEAMQGILDEIGIQMACENSIVKITGNLVNSELSKQYVSKIRASNLFLGVLLAKFGKAVVPVSGGDKIGNRPIDIHLYVFNKFGIRTETIDGYVKCEATQFPYKGQKIFLRFPSVGATENAMLVASAADSETVIYNAAMEPEIVDMAVLLNSMGVKITGAGTPVIHIKPSAAKLTRTVHEVIPDRLEVGTFLFMIAATKGSGIIRNVIPEHVMSVITILGDSGANIRAEDSNIIIDASNCELKPVNVEALPYPGFPTDLQPFASVYALKCNGKSSIRDMIFPVRFNHLFEIGRMGMAYESVHSQVTISGTQKLTGTAMTGTDIRMCASLVMAALIAEGESKIYGLEHILRGYDNFFQKLLNLGADIAVIEDEAEGITIKSKCI
ncbi:UDP-N-acetylglucosamine 1-carboxyvinyltransferase [Anaerocolumna xylanovorans]|uniref:UDP-N-acetylglucosamine 1-carboxyvinyltransferase n=1 Tax=Anaerocolumna xylanovorans DSM 12503 TaxID=1121345 RepID=A0A1M7Y1I4_9FIRM|nr:UDP-N-acetylglucosamine 1-carboxyvinyltransferase [Anaerocolumna xylanovorans]SHO45645.1 UDP-N-acetylglucosamine 1-carboxyvinyltransferase [Anaerocolumna xylanovorans DSM 12503]